MKILIAPNSFKECSDSVRISELIYENLSSRLNFSFILKPVSDGGDGFLTVCKYYFNGRELVYKISSPDNYSTLRCKVIFVEETKTAYVESAEVLGLKRVPSEIRKPLHLSSKGLGELLKKLAEENNVKKVLLGIGGTATMDMGFGACSVFGLKLLDENNRKLEPIPANFGVVRNIQWKELKMPFQLKCILDVKNPLTGKNGAVNVFGKQKGADATSVSIIENGFSNILNLLKNKELTDSSKLLSGAGGGIPAGLEIFLNSSNINAEEFILNHLGLGKKISDSDVIITGEGAFDEQSLMGKGAGIILNRANEEKKKVILVCGKIDEKVKLKLGKNISFIELSSFFKNHKDSIENIETGIRKACDEIIRLIK